jgi:hypothetical protein
MGENNFEIYDRLENNQRKKNFHKCREKFNTYPFSIIIVKGKNIEQVCEIFERLNQHSIQSRINKLLPKEVTEREEEMILNSAFLIKTNKVENFMEAEDALKETFEEMGIFLDCTGPWPPYNFTNVKKV